MSNNARDARLARAQELARIREKQAAMEKKRTRLTVLAIAIPLVILVAIGIWVVASASKGDAGPVGAQSVPKSATGFGQPLVLNEGATEGLPVLDIYEDFQCPYCGQMERSIGTSIYSLAQTGKAKVQIHMMSFLDAKLGNDSSERSLKGLLAADEQGALEKYHALVYENQPANEGQGWTDAQLEKFAKDAGVKDVSAWRESFKSTKWKKYIDSIQTESTKAGITGTPTVKLNGEDVTNKVTSADALVTLVENAQKTSSSAEPSSK